MGWKLPALTVTLWAVALAVIGAAAGVLIHGGTGVVVGAVSGALAGVAAGFVPAIRDSGERQRASREQAIAAWNAVGEPTLDEAPQQGPAVLLRADRAVVDRHPRSASCCVKRYRCSWQRQFA